MHIRAKLYPYPLLESCFGQEDYIDSSFNILVEHKNNLDSVELKFTPVLINAGIQKLIDEGNAYFAVHIECHLTSFRDLYRVGKELILKLDANDVEGFVNICTFIIANNNLREYTNDKFNEDYAGTRFDIEKGNILAIGDSYELEINKVQDNLGNMQSIFGLIESKNENEKDIKIDLSRDKINIVLPKNEFIEFKTMMRTRANHAVLHSMILVPALMQAIDEMKKRVQNNNLYEIEEKKWYRSIVKAAENLGIIIDEENILELPNFETAQKLIANTINRGILNLGDIIKFSGGGEE
ncbi:MAG: hypothetical protein ACI4T1_01485 [Christensenellales bacterium]